MDGLKQVTDIIRESSNIVAFTGAGVSTESNIPDFRSSGGLFKDMEGKYSFPPEVVLSHSFFMQQPEVFYEFYRSRMIYRDAKPNECHKGLAVLEEMGKLKAVVTQNIDGLHQAAGSKNVLELHGTVIRNYCMKCGKFFSLDYIMDMSKAVPLCDLCGGTVRPDVVLYEETLDEDVVQRAVKRIGEAEVLLVIGTSLVVYPAAGFVNYYRGRNMVLINKSETTFDGRARVVLREKAGTVMKEILAGM